MGDQNAEKVTVQAVIQAPIEKVWRYWTEPAHITKWNQASEAWHAPKAENDLRVGGKFLTRMEAKDGSAGFDFAGIYNEVKLHDTLSYSMEDDRTVAITFLDQDGDTLVVETFDAEHTQPIEFQKAGWQAIMDSFKKYTEES